MGGIGFGNMRRLINRYILREIAVPFCMILFVLTFVLLMGKILQVMDLMINKGIGFVEIALLILFLIPSFLVFTIPVSLLIAILIGLGRLSGDNEWTVLKMSGRQSSISCRFRWPSPHWPLF